MASTADPATKVALLAEAQKRADFVPTPPNPSPAQPPRQLALPLPVEGNANALEGRDKFVLKYGGKGLAPGDVTVLTALARDIRLTYPHVQVAIDTPHRGIIEGNPRLFHNFKQWANPTVVQVNYGAGITKQNEETIHFLAWLHRDFEQQTGIPVPVQRPYPDIQLLPGELTPSITGRYWVLVAGGKIDATAKWWSPIAWQQVADRLRDNGFSAVQVGAVNGDHRNPTLSGVTNLVGKTNLREFVRLIAHAEGVICGVTAAMHIAAALHKRCVVVAGGREAWWWEAYVNENRGFGPLASGRVAVPHKFLHTIGLLDCCARHGCWAASVVSRGDNKKVCRLPDVVTGAVLKVPRCMTMITPDQVIEAAMSYYKDESLPPITPGPITPPAIAAQPMAFTTEPSPTPQQPRVMTTAVSQPVSSAAPAAFSKRDDAIFDHPIIGGKFTVCVLLYGDYPDMHSACLNTLRATIPAERMELRIGSNQLGEQSLAMVDHLLLTGKIAEHYRHEENAKKYPVMREMFHDPYRPIETNYTIWFDDDTICDQDPNWIYALSRAIVDGHNDGYRLYGPRRIWSFSASQLDWIRKRPWYRRRPFQDNTGNEVPNGYRIHFASGSFWALHTPLISAQSIPDSDLAHNGGDYTIGAQCYQGGYKLRDFSGHKQHVRWSAYPRRGLSEPHIASS